jgi:hypothetical protein
MSRLEPSRQCAAQQDGEPPVGLPNASLGLINRGSPPKVAASRTEDARGVPESDRPQHSDDQLKRAREVYEQAKRNAASDERFAKRGLR